MAPFKFGDEIFDQQNAHLFRIGHVQIPAALNLRASAQMDTGLDAHHALA